MKKITQKNGDVLFLLMMPPSKGKMPISRTDDGVICLIKKTEGKKRFYDYGSTWMCIVDSVMETKIIVEPIEEVKSVEQNNHEASMAIKAAFGKEKKVKEKKVKFNYPYERKN